MKKNFITIVFLLLFTTIMNVEAYTINVTSKEEAAQTKYVYKSQKQWVSGTSCDADIDIFCIDHGMANQNTFNNCQISDVTGTVYGSVNDADRYTREYMYRVISDKLGTSKVNYNGTSIKDYVKYLSAQNLAVVNSATGSSNLKLDKTALFSYTTTISDSVATVNITANIGQAGLTKADFDVTKGSITSFSGNNGIYKLVVSGINIERCKGAEFEIGIKSTAEFGNSGTQTGSATRKYLAKCPNQNYIIEMKGTCSINELLTGSNKFKLSQTITIDDDTCQCKGEVGFSGECSDGSVSDKKTDFLSCVENGSFKTYCGRELQKTTNNGSGTTQVSSTRTSLTTATLAENPYCAVYCTEDINYDLPGVIETENGRYFKLKEGWNINNPDSGKNISITGKRTCYSSKIDKDAFVEKIKSDQQAIVDAVNNYLLEKAKANAIANQTTSEPDYQNTTCSEYKVKDGKKTDECKTWNTCYTKTTTAKSDYQYKEYSITSCSDSDGTCSKKGTTVGYYEKSWISESTCSDVSVGTALTANPEAVVGAIETANEALNNTLNLYKSCFEWNNNYCFNPIIKFSYDEPYNDLVSGNLGLKSYRTDSKDEKYFETVNSNYENNSETDTGYSLTPKTYLYGKTDSVSTTSTQIDVTNGYVAKSVTEIREYNDATKEIYTYHPYGTIVGKCPAGSEGNCVNLGYVFPVALEHENDSGIYNYYLHIYNVGVPGNDDLTCRLQNGEDEGTKFESGIMGDSSCSLFNSEGGGANEEEYTCQYMTKKCPECEVECICPDGSTNCYEENKVCKYIVCPTCEVKCVGCLWNNGDTTISFKNISLDNVYEDDTTIGSNWTQEEVEKIEDKGQTIYEGKPMYSFTLTPQVMGQIREYNKKSNEGNTSNIPKGGYNNDTLTCSIDENTNTAVNCKSSFLRSYLDRDAINGTLPDRW